MDAKNRCFVTTQFPRKQQYCLASREQPQSDESVSAVIVKDSEAETVTARRLVGCDGGHSTVRKQAGIAFVSDYLAAIA